MTQKILKIGKSLAVTLPKAALKSLGLRAGDRVRVGVDKRQPQVLLESPKNNIDKELLLWTRKFIKKYRPALEALAKK
jgi:putative addiction module antidote